MLTEKDINIFTIVKDKNTISPLRQWCIDSWHESIPNANIMIFDDNDLNNPNWKYYDVIKNDRLWNYYKNREYEDCGCDLKFYRINYSPISTDSIRIRLLKAIPNALYMDSDAYLNITSKEFLELCNKYGDFNINVHDLRYPYRFNFDGYFAGAKNILLDNMIEYYSNMSERDIVCDHAMVQTFFKTTPRLKEYNNIGLFNTIDKNIIHLSLSSIKPFNIKEYGINKIVVYIGDRTNSRINKLVEQYRASNEDHMYIDYIKNIIHDKLFNSGIRFGKNELHIYLFNIETVYTSLDRDRIHHEDGRVFAIAKMYHSFFDKLGLHDEFVEKLKGTIDAYFKPMLNGGEIIYQELPEL